MTDASLTIPIIDSVGDIGARYRAWLVDIWGVMHNGQAAFAQAAAATRAFRESGGVVVLLSNSPRPSPDVQEQLRQFGVPDDAYDATVTSGDLTRHELGKYTGARVFHLGPERDRPIFAGLDVVLAGPEEADLVVCSVYETFGGKVVYAGKPHVPVYELALETIAQLSGEAVGRERVLAIGDGVNTDIAGAAALGIDAVFVASALHAPGEGGQALDAPHLNELFAQTVRRPIAAMRGLNW
jgi:ribonucleotide monophosphatase NagD (HAD superfamily)